jgi:hypothetical protein
MADDDRPHAPAVLGADRLLQKRSAVDELGDLRATLIEGLIFRPTRPVPHDDGHLTEVARASWDVPNAPIVQVHLTIETLERFTVDRTSVLRP